MISSEILTVIADQQALSPEQQKVFLLRFAEGKSYNAINNEYGISKTAISQRMSQIYKKFEIQGKTKGKESKLRLLLNDRVHNFNSKDSSGIQQRKTDEINGNFSSQQSQHPTSDWGEAPDVSTFYGREEELNELKQWIIPEDNTPPCRLLVLLGMGGMGKTALSVKLAQGIQEKFDYVIWRSLRNAPSLKNLLAELIQILSQRKETNLPDSIDNRISRLIHYLQEQRCLLLLDNIESVFKSQNIAGFYKEEHEKYGELFQRIGEVNHKSCLILTTREKPQKITLLEGTTVRVKRLKGLDLEGFKILEEKQLQGNNEEKKALIELYSGNPLALKIISTIIKEIFSDNISLFLQQVADDQGNVIPELKTAISQGIRDLLKQQFERLSQEEREIMYWLAINRNYSVSLEILRQDILVSITKGELLATLKSLVRRCLIESRDDNAFGQHPVVREYVTERLIEEFCEEIESIAKNPSQCNQFYFLNNYALLNPQAKDYLKKASIRLILTPISYKLVQSQGNIYTVVKQLYKVLNFLKENCHPSGYAAGNILNLLCNLRNIQKENSNYDPEVQDEQLIYYSQYSGFWQFNFDFKNADFSGIAVWSAALQGENLQGINFANSNLHKSVFSQKFGSILSVDFSSDGKFLATGDSNGDIYLWKVKKNPMTLSNYKILKGHTDWVRTVKFSPDGQWLVSGGSDQTVRLWNLETEQYKILGKHQSRVRCVAFSSKNKSENNQWIASGSDDKTIKVWKRKSHQDLTFSRHSNFAFDDKLYCQFENDTPVRALVFTPDGERIISGSYDKNIQDAGHKNIKIWDLKTKKCIQEFPISTPIRTLAIHPKGHSLASGGEDNKVRIWNLETGKMRKELSEHKDWVWSVAFSPDGKHLASAGDDKRIIIWRLENYEPIDTLSGHKGRVWSIAFIPDSRAKKSQAEQILVSGGEDQTLRLWNIDQSHNRKRLQLIRGYTKAIWSVAISPDGKMIASGSDDAKIRIGRMSDGERIQNLKGHDKRRIRSVAFSPDSNKLASASEDGTVKLWNLKTGECEQTFYGHYGPIYSVAYHPDKKIKILASGGDDRIVTIWKINSDQPPYQLLGHTDWVRCVTFSLDGKLVASASDDGTAKLWDWRKQKCIYTLKPDSDTSVRVRSVAFSRDGKMLASGHLDNIVRLWDVHSGKLLKELKGHEDRVWSVAFHPQKGHLLASSSHDKTIRLWDVKTEECKILSKHEKGVWSVAFDPDGTFLASGSQDETIRLWEVQTGNCHPPLRSPRPYEDMNIYGATGLTEAQKNTLLALGAVENPVEERD